jgi:hypothetical protein
MSWPTHKNYMKTGGVYTHNSPKSPLGSGGRFAALKSKLGKRGGVSNPGALAAWIGRRKYGAAKMAKMSAAGRKHG